MKELFEEYAQIKLQLAELEERRRELETQVLDELDSTGGRYEMSVGTFSSYGRKVWKYSANVDRLKTHLSETKKLEEQTGTAELQKVTNVLTFTPTKKHEQ